MQGVFNGGTALSESVGDARFVAFAQAVMNILLTLGRLAKGLELARSLWQAGHRVIIADPFALHLCRPSRAVSKTYRVTAPTQDLDAYLADLLNIIETNAVDLIIPVSEEALYTSRIAPYLPDSARLFGPSFSQMSRLHDKLAFAGLCQKRGLTAPRTFAATTPAAQELAQSRDYVVKPIHGCSGIGVRLRHRGAPLTPDDLSAGNLIQERLYGRQISSFSIVRDGQIKATALYQGDIYLGTVSVRFSRVDDLPQVEDWVAAFVAAENYTGFISFDFFVTDEGTPFAIECNPRLTSGIHLMDRGTIAALTTDVPLTAPTFKPHRFFQDGHAALTVACGAILRPRDYFRMLAKVVTTKDVVFDWSDPAPFFLMTPMSWDTLRQGLFQGVALADAVTRDILWTGDPSPVPLDQKRIRPGDALP